MANTVTLDTLVIGLQVFAAVLSSGVLWKIFTLASRFGRIEEKIDVLERDARAAKNTDKELDDLQNSVGVIHTQIGNLQTQVTSLQTMVLERIIKPTGQ